MNLMFSFLQHHYRCYSELVFLKTRSLTFDMQHLDYLTCYHLKLASFGSLLFLRLNLYLIFFQQQHHSFH